MKLERWDPETLPKHPSIAILGKRRSGKSEVLKSLCKDYWKNIYTNVYVFSQTASVNGFYDGWCPSSFIFEDVNEEVVENIIKRQEALTKMNRTSRPSQRENISTLLIFDDIGLNDAKYSKVLHKIMLQGRHLHIACVYLIQDATMISRVMRDNLDAVMTFNLPNKIQRDRIVESFLMVNDRQEGEDVLKLITSRQYYIMVIDNTKTNSYQLNDFVYWYKSELAKGGTWRMASKRQWTI